MQGAEQDCERKKIHNWPAYFYLPNKQQTYPTPPNQYPQHKKIIVATNRKVKTLSTYFSDRVGGSYDHQSIRQKQAKARKVQRWPNSL